MPRTKVPPVAPSTPTTATPPTTPPALPTPIGVGIDTARYGHHATFLRPDLQPAAKPLDITENAPGYDQLRQRLQTIAEHHGPVHFHFRIDVAGVYADNLLTFLAALPEPKTISCGDPQRNQNYRAAVCGAKKSDPVESYALARFALTEKPRATLLLSAAQRLLRSLAGRLQAHVRQRTRLVNQLHQLLARAFPELALLVEDLSTGWVLELLDHYPSAARIAAARPASLQALPYLPHELVPRLQQQARDSLASLTGPLVEDLVRDQVRQVRDACLRQKRLENWLVQAYRDLPQANHLDTIKGIGPVTAAVLTAFILDIGRFATPNHLVGYFGIFPVKDTSGVERDGNRRVPKGLVMSPRGNDLVRRYLWLAALAASRHNPAVRPLYQRVRAKHPERPSIAIGHCMRKLLHLVFAIWKSGQPFDPGYYPWERPSHMPSSDSPVSLREPAAPAEPAAGLKPETEPARSEVTATGSTSAAALPQSAAASAAPWIDFGHLREQLPLARVLEHLGLLADLRGRGSQRRGSCPIHNPGGGGRSFSVNLTDNVWHCFDAGCSRQGDVIDLWSALRGQTLRAAALELVQTFGLEPAPPGGTEKRHGSK